MRTTVIPAQITTIEDKIAGNLSLTQILILMVPVFWTAIVYTLLTPAMKLAWYKFPLILIVLFICLTLSLRIKGKVVLNWLIVLLNFNVRPKYYLFNKNDAYQRIIDLPVVERKQVKLFKEKVVTKEAPKTAPNFAVSDFVAFENFINNPNYSLSFKSKKGGVNVAFEQIKK
ncbi:hypothetical protein HYU93_00060 [Candidatus Daviesbacteria bacterium]|nr:hypothetical protein [Candidatus Daviesbacteria bacterium]